MTRTVPRRNHRRPIAVVNGRQAPSTEEREPMPIEVRIPTIMRNLTDGAKAVEGSGSTLGELIDDLDSRHPGLGAKLVDGGKLRRFVNVYLNDYDVSVLGGFAPPGVAVVTAQVQTASVGGLML